MLVLGITLVVLLVGMVVNTNMKTADKIPDDQALLDWYVVYSYGPDSKVSTFEKDGDYIHYDAFDEDGNLTRFGSVLKSYLIDMYERNN